MRASPASSKCESLLMGYRVAPGDELRASIAMC
jgi:hypothetical protein